MSNSLKSVCVFFDRQTAVAGHPRRQHYRPNQAHRHQKGQHLPKRTVCRFESRFLSLLESRPYAGLRAAAEFRLISHHLSNHPQRISNGNGRRWSHDLRLAGEKCQSRLWLRQKTRSSQARPSGRCRGVVSNHAEGCGEGFVATALNFIALRTARDNGRQLRTSPIVGWRIPTGDSAAKVGQFSGHEPVQFQFAKQHDVADDEPRFDAWENRIHTGNDVTGG